jgi:diguanylate cyclase (GGDEF)-like protein
MVAALSGMSAVSSRTAMAGTDSLTRVANRAAFLAALRVRLSQVRRPEEPVTLLLVDLDGFKLVNDLYGHPTGDSVLAEVAQRLEESTRAEDLVARLGGDEFAVLLANGVTSRTAGEVANRITEAVAQPIEVAGRTLLVGASIGWAVTSASMTDPNSLMERADAELYRAKAARGRTPNSARTLGSGLGRPSAVGGIAELDEPGEVRATPWDSRSDRGWDEPTWSLAHGGRVAAPHQRG